MSNIRTFIIPALATYGEYDAERNESKREITLLSGETVTFLNLNTYAEKHAETDDLFVQVEVERGTPLDDQLLERFYNGDVELKHVIEIDAFQGVYGVERALKETLGDAIMDRHMRLEWDVAYLVERASMAASTAPHSSSRRVHIKNTLIAIAALLDFYIQVKARGFNLEVTIVESLGARHYSPCQDEPIEHIPVTLTGEIKADINTIPASEWDAAWSKQGEPWSAGDNIEAKPF